MTFLPQRQIAAPGRTLREQLTYPSTSPVTPEHLHVVLSTVQLSHLLDRVDYDWEREHDWQGEIHERVMTAMTSGPK